MKFAKDIPGYEGRYAIDMVGNVFSYHSRKTLKANHAAKSGHVSICLGHPNVRRWVHELVLTTFVGPRPDGTISRHLDGNPKHNDVFNLEWATQSRNMLDVKYHRPDRVGRLNASQVLEIRDHLASGVPMLILQEWYGVSDSNIAAIRDGITHRDV